MDGANIADENRRLEWAWDRHPAGHLEDYLVRGVEDPRINAQSILTRGLLADALYPGRFTEMIEAEMRFGIVLTWAQRELEAHRDRHELLDYITEPADPGIPPVVAETHAWLQKTETPLPDYIRMALDYTNPDEPDQRLNPAALDTFMDLWREAWPERPARHLRVLEVGCGSANDYRFMCRSGLSAHIEYTGLDISGKNIDNARRLCPEGSFIRGSILDSGIESDAHDCVFAHDLLEHLSGGAVDLAIEEMTRITRGELWLHLFRTTAASAHAIVPDGLYHRNSISVTALVASLAAGGFDSETLAIGAWMENKFGFRQHYNPSAVSVLAVKRRPGRAPRRAGGR